MDPIVNESPRPDPTLEGKMMASFVCTVCNGRVTKVFSKLSYEKGVVLIRCPSCENHHLIADNLGWFRDTAVNIEILMKEKGETVKYVTKENMQLLSEDIQQFLKTI